MAMGKGMEAFEQKMQAKLATEKGMQFDPTIIISIISALIPLIQGCFQKTPKAVRVRFFNRARVANNLREKVNDLSFVQAMKLADQIFDVADKASDEEVKAFIDDCCA